MSQEDAAKDYAKDLELRRSRKMRNDKSRKDIKAENINEKRQRILFESFENAPALSSEIQTSLEILRQVKAQEDSK